MRQQLKPSLTRPVDFERFWQRTLEQLDEVAPDIERQHVATRGAENLLLEHVFFDSLGGVRIRAYLLSWQDHASRPLAVHAHGYGAACQPHWQWARAGLNVLGVDIRGFGASRDAVPQPSKWGYVLTGCETPEGSVLRGAMCDFARTVQVGRLLLADQTSRLILHGASFAGSLALAAEALTHAADLLVLAVPTLGWAEGRNFFVQSGSGAEIQHYLDERPEATEDLMLVLRYFDSMNFAPLVTCPTLVGVGLSDVVVPAKTVYAIANHLGGPHAIMEFPVSHSDSPEERLWKAFDQRWIQLAIEGLPADFGRQAPNAQQPDA